jgi:hypothetical protein
MPRKWGIRFRGPIRLRQVWDKLRFQKGLRLEYDLLDSRKKQRKCLTPTPPIWGILGPLFGGNCGLRVLVMTEERLARHTQLATSSNYGESMPNVTLLPSKV